MPISSLFIENFRNISSFGNELSPKLNVIRGENAQGKTNFLEAIYYLANGKSFRIQENQNLILFTENQAKLRVEILHQNLKNLLEVQISGEERSVKFQNKPVYRYQKIHETLRVLVFTPDSTTLFRSSPASRRRYLDHAISVQKNGYAPLLARYMRIVSHRNRLLERGNFAGLEEFDSQWIVSYQEIIAERQSYLQELLPFWKRRFKELSGMTCEIRAQWETSSEPYQNIDTACLKAALERVREKEKILRHTLLGAHRDDLRLFFDEHPIRQVASQGQQRLVVIALKLAEADLFQEGSSRAPIFLLDDLGSELDALRQERLFGVLEAMEAQTFLTTTQEVTHFNSGAWEFEAKSGRIDRK